MKKYLYHTTPYENVNPILKNGLIRRGAFISLSEDRNSWMVDGNVLFQVDIRRYIDENPDVMVTTWLPELDEICVWADIANRYLQLIHS